LVFRKQTLILIFLRKQNMKIFKRFLFSLVFILGLVSTPFLLSAQPIDPCTDPDDPCPIDSGVVLLVVAVVAIAAKKTYDFKKNVDISKIV
jgi:hypothetical protein